MFSKKNTAKYQNLINDIVYGKLTGKVKNGYQSQAMLVGTEREPEARKEFEFVNNLEVEGIGFISLDDFIGVSPDGLIGEDGLLEIKCPAHTTQIQRLTTEVIPAEYITQMQMQIWVSGREYCYFFSYHPDLPNFQKKIAKDDNLINEIFVAINEAEDIITEKINKIKGLK